MININKFIDRIASVEGRQGKDVILPISEAKAIRDEITKLLIENKNLSSTSSSKNDEIVEVQIVGKRW